MRTTNKELDHKQAQTAATKAIRAFNPVLYFLPERIFYLSSVAGHPANNRDKEGCAARSHGHSLLYATRNIEWQKDAPGAISSHKYVLIAANKKYQTHVDLQQTRDASRAFNPRLYFIPASIFYLREGKHKKGSRALWQGGRDRAAMRRPISLTRGHLNTRRSRQIINVNRAY